MTGSVTVDDRVAELGRASRRAAVISLLGFLLVVGALTYAIFQLRNLERERQKLERSVTVLRDSVGLLERRTQELLRTQNGVLDFLGGVTAGERIRLIDQSVNWEQTKRYVMALESGPRKDAILAAVLLAWKELPFSLDNRGLSSGLDSPHFMEVVLSSVGVTVKPRPRERLSDAMMRQFSRVDSPLPGDLIFYRGNVGSFVLMYMGPGSPGGKGIAVGTLQTGEEVQVLDTANINTPVYPFIGFFRVPYPQ
jgi:hypothetical protein